MIKLAFMASGAYSEMAPEKVVKSLKQIGYEGLGWTLNHFNPRKKTPAELKALIEISRNEGLGVSELVVQQDIICVDESIRKDRIDFGSECINAAGEFGIKTVNMFTGPVPWNPDAARLNKDISISVAWKMAFEAFGQWLQTAEDVEVNIAVEGVFGMLCHDYYTTKFLLDNFNHPLLGVNFDPSHDILYGNCDVEWLINQWGDKIKHSHIKDAAGQPEMGKFLFPLIGEGLVDWNQYFTAFDKIGYDGFCSVEFESFNYLKTVLKNDIEQAALLSFRNISKLMEDL